MELIISIIAVCFYYKVATKYFSILQQQYYNVYRFMNVVIEKKSFTLDSILVLLTMIIFAIIGPFDSSFILYSIIVLILIHIYKRKQIVKLKYTRRIIRMYLFLGVFLIITFLISYHISIKHFYIIMPITYVNFPILVLLSNVALMPVEKIINNKYVRHAKQKLREINPIIIAITGSYGKTSTKHFLQSILSTYYPCIATPSSYNTILGIVKTINDKLTKEHKIFIVEVGVDQVNGMNKFLKLFTPNYVIVTSVGPQHLKTFKSIENILKEKMKLANIVDSNGVVLLNGDNQYLSDYPVINNTVYYGFNNRNDCLLEILKQSNGITYFSVGKKKFETTILGNHLLLNLSAAIQLAIILKVPYMFIYNAVKKLENYDHRLKLIKKEKYLIIDDSYNSNLEGFINALDVLKTFNKYRVLITPGLIELGDKSYEYNLKVAQYSIDKIDYAIIIGDLKPFREVYEQNNIKYKQVASYNEAIKKAESLIYKDIVILIENDLPDNYLS